MDRLEPSLVRVLKALGVKELNPLQHFAADNGVFDGKNDYALVAMSRTGKSFTGALFVANQLFKAISSQEQGSPDPLAIIITPFHASARDLSSTLSKFFGWFLRPVVFLRQTRSVLDISKEFSPNVIIATPEAAQDLVRQERGREWLLGKSIQCVVLDDVHSVLHDPERGARLIEVALFFRRSLSRRPRMLILSGRFDESERLETLFGVKLVVDKTEYPSPEIRLVNYSGTEEKETKLSETLDTLMNQGATVLVYLQSIDAISDFLSRNGASLSEAASLDTDSLVRTRLQRIAAVLDDLGYEDSPLVARGVGSYHGLMNEYQRWFIEWAFRRRYLRVMLGTEALAYGLNTPVSDVVMGSPGMDEVFRQSMMARSVTLRRGKVLPGRTTVFAKSIEETEQLERVYSCPKMPTRYMNDRVICRMMLGLIGLGLMRNEDDRAALSALLDPFYKKDSTTKALKTILSSDPPLAEEKSDSYVLTQAGKIAFEAGLSGEQALTLLDALRFLAASGQEPTETDLLLLLAQMVVLDGHKLEGVKTSMEEFRSFITSRCPCVLESYVFDSERFEMWSRAVQYAATVRAYLTDDDTLAAKIRRSPDRLMVEMKFNSALLAVFLAHPFLIVFLPTKKRWPTLPAQLLELMDSEMMKAVASGKKAKKVERLSGWNLDFVDFGDIERTIDSTLQSDLTPAHKIQLIELFENVDSTTSALIDLLGRTQDDTEAKEVLEIVSGFSSGSRLGENLTKALEEQGVIRPNTATLLWNRFNSRVDTVRKKTDTPSKAANLMVSLFTGNLLGLATGSYTILKVAMGKTKGKVDTSGIL